MELHLNVFLCFCLVPRLPGVAQGAAIALAGPGAGRLKPSRPGFSMPSAKGFGSKHSPSAFKKALQCSLKRLFMALLKTFKEVLKTFLLVFKRI